MTRTIQKLVHEGRYAAEVSIEVSDQPEAWGATISLEDARRLDRARMALRAGNLAEASRYGRVFEMLPITA